MVRGVLSKHLKMDIVGIMRYRAAYMQRSFSSSSLHNHGPEKMFVKGCPVVNPLTSL
jgi:hypothetical protein